MKNATVPNIHSWFVTFLVFCGCGFAGSILDADHFDKILQNSLPITWENTTGRGLHIPYFLAFCVILLSSLTYFYRLDRIILKENET